MIKMFKEEYKYLNNRTMLIPIRNGSPTEIPIIKQVTLFNELSNIDNLFVITNQELYLDEEFIGLGKDYVARDFETGIKLTSGKTQKETDDKLYQIVKHPSGKGMEFINKLIGNSEKLNKL